MAKSLLPWQQKKFSFLISLLFPFKISYFSFVALSLLSRCTSLFFGVEPLGTMNASIIGGFFLFSMPFYLFSPALACFSLFFSPYYSFSKKIFLYCGVHHIEDPLQGDFPEVIEEYLEYGCMKCIAFNRRGTLLAGKISLSFSLYFFLSYSTGATVIRWYTLFD